EWPPRCLLVRQSGGARLARRERIADSEWRIGVAVSLFAIRYSLSPTPDRSRTTAACGREGLSRRCRAAWLCRPERGGDIRLPRRRACCASEGDAARRSEGCVPRR